jgi:uncharacterized protein (TIGR03435 family)
MSFPATFRIPTPRLEQMLQALLADRFHLVLDRTAREMPVYVLSSLGIPGKPEPTEPGPPSGYFAGFSRFPEVRNPLTGKNFGDIYVGAITGSMTIRDLIQSLEFATKRPVVDRTGLTDSYRVEVYFAPGEIFGITEAGRGRPLLDHPSLKEALESELGLKFESSRAPVDVFVVQRVDKPSEN